MEEEKYCPNCGRYVGSLEVCPYCGTKIPKHTSYYYAKYGSLTFAVFGIIFLLLFAQSTPVQYVHIGDIGPTYNYATIMIKGVVTTAPSLVLKSDGSQALYINVDDGTGTMAVHAYNPVTGRLAHKDKIPGYGEFVVITGEVYFRGSNRYMIINDPAQITIKKADAVKTNITSIERIQYPAGNYMRVEILGHIIGSKKTFSGAYLLKFSDGSGTIPVFVPTYIVHFYGFDPENYSGKTVELFGALQWYGSSMSGEWEIVPSSIDDFKVVK